MSDAIRYAISVEPREELDTENGGTETVIASEVSKVLGGSGSAAVTDYSGTAVMQGYKDGAVHYLECTDDAGKQLTTEATASFVLIKNTGYTYSSATELGSSSSNSVKVTVVNNDTTLIGILDAGECLVLKDDNAGIDASEIYVQTVTSSGGAVTDDHLAVEYLVVD